jgi:hypothetical protein
VPQKITGRGGKGARTKSEPMAFGSVLFRCLGGCILSCVVAPHQKGHPPDTRTTGGLFAAFGFW